MDGMHAFSHFVSVVNGDGNNFARLTRMSENFGLTTILMDLLAHAFEGDEVHRGVSAAAAHGGCGEGQVD